MLSFHISSWSRTRKQAAKLSGVLFLRGWGLLSAQGLLAQALDTRCALVGAQSLEGPNEPEQEHHWVSCRVVAELVHPLCLICWGESCS